LLECRTSDREDVGLSLSYCVAVNGPVKAACVWQSDIYNLK